MSASKDYFLRTFIKLGINILKCNYSTIKDKEHILLYMTIIFWDHIYPLL